MNEPVDLPPRFLSLPWLQSFVAHCQADAELRHALRGFSATTVYGWLDREYAPVFLRLKKGEPEEIGEGEPAKAQFRVFAQAATWEQIHRRQLSGKKALLSKQLAFRGSMLTLIRFMEPINGTFARMGDIPARFD